jgi:thioredoxin 1
MALNGIVLVLVAAGIGALIGGALGATRSCETGGCPLTANPGRGAVVGAILGITVAFASGVGSGSCPFLAGPAAGGSGQTAGEHGANLTSLTTDTFETAVSKGVVLVDFWATWCGPCQRQLPILDGMAADESTPFNIVKVNVDEQKPLAQKYEVSLLPTLMFFRDGKPVKTLEGLHTKQAVLKAYSEL